MPRSPAPGLICLVTDRRRLPEPAQDNLVDLVRAASIAGVDIIQVRERDLDDRGLHSLTCRIVEAVHGTNAKVVVNDRVDIALAAGAAGVHLRGDSIAAGRVRAIVPPSFPGFLVGRSVHAVAEAASAGDVDYLVAGTVYSTKSKPAASTLLGTAGLGAICAVSTAPVLAIGGVTADKLGELAAAGSAGVAAIGLFSDVWIANRAGDAAGALNRIVADVRRAFAR
jgi:thiamine-phosphate pyrophosphorylase